MKKNRFIAVSATLEPLLVASQIYDKGDEVIGAGNKIIFSVLDKVLRKKAINEFIIILSDDAVVERLIKKQKELKKGTKKEISFINIYLKRRNTRYSFKRSGYIKNLYFCENEVEVSKLYSKASHNFNLEKSSNNKYIDTLVKFYVTRFLMDMNFSNGIETLVATLNRNNLNRFSEKSDPSIPWAAIKLFQEQECPFLSGKSKKIKDLKKRIAQVGKTDLRVLVVGETGTGKELVSFFIHDCSKRSGKPFVSLNCAGLDETFLHSELFGYVKGAFTGAVSDKMGLVHQAEGGTLFLDEIGDMPPLIQADLLRFLNSQKYRMLGSTKEKKANVRIIAAGQPSIFNKLSNNTFRDDLYYRLAEVKIETPALRDIPEDIETMIKNICYERIKKNDKHAKDAFRYFKTHINKLKKYPWPGNFRELAALVKRRTILKDEVVEELNLSKINDNLDVGNIGKSPRKYLENETSEIRPWREVQSDYFKKVRKDNPNMTLYEITQKLKVAENTFKKYLKY